MNNTQLTELVRFKDINREPWFVLKDVCSILGIKNHNEWSGRIKDSWKDGVVFTDPMGREQKLTVINEAALNKLIFKSKKPEAEKLQDWVYEEVLPEIRKTGSYKNELSTEEILDKFIEDRLKLKAEVKRLEKTKAYIANKQVATALNTASQARKSETKALEALGMAGNYLQVKGIKWLSDYFRTKDSKTLNIIGRQLSKLSKENGYDPHKVDDIKYGSVNAYHKSIIEMFMQKLLDEPEYLNSYRKGTADA